MQQPPNQPPGAPQQQALPQQALARLQSMRGGPGQAGLLCWSKLEVTSGG